MQTLSEIELQRRFVNLSEDLETKRFESKTEINELTQNFTETKKKIYDELREAALRINDTRHSFIRMMIDC